MELSLNLFWLLLAIMSLALWRQQTPLLRGRRQRHRSLHGLMTLGCALALLFPVISITDDLHAEQAIIEDSNPCKRALISSGASCVSSELVKFSHPSSYNVLRLFSSPFNRILEIVDPIEGRLASSVSVSSCEGRAPPSPHN